LSKQQPKEKPSIETVLEYADRQVKISIENIARKHPREQKDEMSQNAMLRVIEKYDGIDVEKGWKSYIQRHCSGAVLDYIRCGHGFEEQTLTPRPKKDENGNVIEPVEKKPWRLKKRVNPYWQTHDSLEELDVDEIAGKFGVYNKAIDLTEFKPKWQLLARMASQDVDIHLVAKLLLGFTQTELSSMFMVSRERLTQRFAAFCKRLDDPELYNSKWIQQTIYAFGLTHEFDQPDIDLGFGWEYDEVDLWSRDINYIEKLNPQMIFEFNYN